MSKKKPEKYTIKDPRKCQYCDKATTCELLKMLHEKPFDASGVILDCKAFYTVFKELEERCKIPFDDPEKMKKYHEETDAGTRPFLTPAMVTNGMLAVELAIKALTLKETGTFDCTHDIDLLFNALPDKHKTELSTMIKQQLHQTDDSLKFYLKTIKNYFVEWHYFFEKEHVGFTNFLTEFIYLVCDYAIKEIDNY